MTNNEITTDLTAIVIYLNIIGKVYPVAPEVPIATLLKVIDALQDDKARLAGPASGLEGGA